MSRAVGHCDRPDRPFPLFYLTILSLVIMLSLSSTFLRVGASPVPDLMREYQNLVTANSTDNSTEIAIDSDVYVIKAVVYEIGILTDTDNSTSDSTERHERVDISLYDPPHHEDEFS